MTLHSIPNPLSLCGGPAGKRDDAPPASPLVGVNSNPHADRTRNRPEKSGIASVKVAGGRCDCKTLSHTPNNPAGIQFYSPWQTQGWRP